MERNFSLGGKFFPQAEDCHSWNRLSKVRTKNVLEELDESYTILLKFIEKLIEIYAESVILIEKLMENLIEQLIETYAESVSENSDDSSEDSSGLSFNLKQK